jgi:hypothetical protein
MIIPKYIDELIEQRQTLAERLNCADVKLCDWMEKQGIDLIQLNDCVRTGCMMYCEPGNAANAVREAINNHNKNS